MRVFLDRLYLSAGILAGCFLVLLFVLMMLLSAGRPLGLNIPVGDDYASWTMAAVSFLGLAHTFRHGEMIRVGLLIDRLQGRTKQSAELLALIVGTFFVGFFAYYAVSMTYDSWRFNDMSQGIIAYPLWIPQLGYSGGLVILLIAFVEELVNVLRGNRPRYEKQKPKTAEEAIEQAIQTPV